MRVTCNYFMKGFFFVFVFVLVSAHNVYGIGFRNPDWKVIKILHFDIYHTDETADSAVLCARMAEESYVYVANKLHHELNFAVEIILSGPGHYYGNNVSASPSPVSDPVSGSNPCSIHLFYNGSYSEMHRELTHQLVHSFQYDILFDNASVRDFIFSSLSGYPVSIIQGMAEYLSSGYDEYSDILMLDIIRNSDFPDIEERYFESSYNERISPDIRKSFFYFLESTYGEDIFRDLLHSLKTCDLHDAVELAAMTDMETIKEKWIGFFRERYASLIKDISFQDDIEQVSMDGAGPVFALKAQDNENIYYLNSDNNRFVLSKVNMSTGESERKLRYNAGNKISGLYDFAFFNNYPAISQEKDIAAFLKRDSRDIIILADMRTGKTIEEIKLPFKGIKDLDLSADGNLLAFSGMGNSSTDIYIYNISDKSVFRVTDDLFTGRFPKISPDNAFIVFCSNANDADDPEHNDYKLIRFDMESGTVSVLADKYNNIHPDISSDCTRILYVSNASGIFNAYYYDMFTGENTRITDSLSGAFFPRWIPGENRIIFTSYSNSGYNAYTAVIDGKGISQGQEHGKGNTGIEYPDPYFDTSDSVLFDYRDESNENAFFSVTGAVLGNAFLGSADMLITDTLNFHELDLETGYRRIDAEDYANISLEYDYLRYGPDFGLGCFYRSNPMDADMYSYERSLNEYYKGLDKHYGLFGIVNFPFWKGFNIGLKGSSGIYSDIDSLNLNKGNDIHSHKLSASFSFDNMVRNKGYHMQGVRYEAVLGNVFDITEGSSVYRTINLNFYNDFCFLNRICLSVLGSWGKIFGQDAGEFAYYLGARSIRGHNFHEYNGSNAFVLNTEIRMILFKRINIFWPFIMKVNDLSLALFLDAGSAWDKEFTLMDPAGDEFDDLKAGTGAGLRFVLCDHSLFKLDFAWPYSYKSFGSRDVIVGFEFRF